MQKKMSKKAILALPLITFNIRPLTLWVTRPERKMKGSLENARRRYSGEILDKELAECRTSHQKVVDAQPLTVGDLVKAYPYRYVHRRTHTNYGVNGSGKEPIIELKKKLLELGLTPDDWPALAPHDELLQHLSKATIMNVPVREVIVLIRYKDDDGLRRYLGCTSEEVVNKTIRDLIQIDPLNAPNPDDSCYSNGASYFRDHKRLFVALHQQLIKKGFTTRDGAFLRWNPTAPAFKKAQKVLRNYNLTPSELRKFAKIVVAERWIV